jgi:hypothetical protein
MKTYNPKEKITSRTLLSAVWEYCSYFTGQLKTSVSQNGPMKESLSFKEHFTQELVNGISNNIRLVLRMCFIRNFQIPKLQLLVALISLLYISTLCAFL